MLIVFTVLEDSESSQGEIIIMSLYSLFNARLNSGNKIIQNSTL